MLIPGGIENCRRYSNNEISTGTFLQKITEDVRDDAIAAMLGSLIGAGAGGASAALASGGAMAIPGAVIGAKEGAAIGIAVSRAVKAGVRSSGGGGRTEAVRIQRTYGEGKFWDGMRPDSNLSGKAKGPVKTDGRYFYKFDPAHKTQKVHLHKYEHKGGNKYRLIEEIDPETGRLIREVKGEVEIW